jgi:Glycosyltransferases involved in cell wall biogenesis
VVPARNEAEGIGDCVSALLRQDYPGVLHVIVVDDQSSDGTAERAREAASRAGCCFPFGGVARRAAAGKLGG